jgi:DNA-directed RNA polymerase subunit omega
MSTSKGIIDPPIDELLAKVDSKYQLVIVASKRARQINDYYVERAEGTVTTAGPLVEFSLEEKPLTIAMREINEGLIEIGKAP